MNKIKQVGPNHWVGPVEEGYEPHFHNTERARRNYPFGGLVREDVLNPPEKVIDFDLSELDKPDDLTYSAYDSFSAGVHDDYLDMRLHSVTGRGRAIGASLFLTVLIWLPTKITLMYQGFTEVINPLDVLWFSCCLLALAWDILRPIAIPVRFNRKNREVYVKHKGVLYRIPWTECEISTYIAMAHIGYGQLKDGYELVIWLNPKHAVNKTIGGKHRRLVLSNEMGWHLPAYGYWDYVRGFMNYESIYTEKRDRPKIMGPRDGTGPYPIAVIVTIIFTPLLLIIRSTQMALRFDSINPFSRRWPKEVDKWTGEKRNWH